MEVFGAGHWSFFIVHGLPERRRLCLLTVRTHRRFRERSAIRPPGTETTRQQKQSSEDQERSGRVAPTLDADLVVLAADPAQDARAFVNVRYTFRRGRMIYGNL